MSRIAAIGAAITLTAALPGIQSCSVTGTAGVPRYTFELRGGYFYGPGPVVPDTSLPDGRLRNIRFDTAAFRGQCDFANDGTASGLLSDRRTKVNQNIDAGQLLIGGGTSPILLAAVDGGPHHGTEQYYLDDQYRFVWRVDIALDPGFEEGIIRLDDFVLDTGVTRIGRSLQSRRGEPGGYDQAGTLLAGAFLVGRVGDFDQDDRLDGVLVAAPNVPLIADMLPGAPVGNRRGFRTDIPISAQLSAELMLRGALHLRDPLLATVEEQLPEAYAVLIADLDERLRVIHARAASAIQSGQWTRGGMTTTDPANLLGLLEGTRPSALGLDASTVAERIQLITLFSRIEGLIEDVSELNARSGVGLPSTRVATESLITSKELHQKSY